METPSKRRTELLHGFVAATSDDKTTRTGSRAKEEIRCSKNASTKRAKVKLSIYVDWIDDPQLNRAHVTPETAAKLRDAMRRSTCLLYAASVNASASKWMPWEVGFSDALHSRVAVLPLADENALVQAYHGQEFMGIYPYVDDKSLGELLLNSQQETRVVPFQRWLNSAGNAALKLIKS